MGEKLIVMVPKLTRELLAACQEREGNLESHLNIAVVLIARNQHPGSACCPAEEGQYLHVIIKSDTIIELTYEYVWENCPGNYALSGMLDHVLGRRAPGQRGTSRRARVLMEGMALRLPHRLVVTFVV